MTSRFGLVGERGGVDGIGGVDGMEGLVEPEPDDSDNAVVAVALQDAACFTCGACSEGKLGFPKIVGALAVLLSMISGALSSGSKYQ